MHSPQSTPPRAPRPPADLNERLPTSAAKILLVDDKVANLIALEVMLDELREDLVRATSGEDALRLLAEDDFAVVLLDVRMPTMSGFETARRIREQPRARRTPIVFLTAAHEDEFSPAEAYQLGAVDFMTKPLSPAVLRAKVAIFVDLFRKTHESARAERDKAASTIKAKDERLRLILDNTTDYGFVLADLDGTISEWEGGAPAVTGWSADEAVGQPISLIFTPEDRDASVPIAEMTRAAEMGRATDRRWHLRKDGGRFFADGVMVGLRDQNGGLQGYAKIFRDATAEHLAAIELEATRDREHRAAEDLRKLAAELSEANRRKTEFLAVLAHELRNPLAPIRNGLQILKLIDDAPASMVKAREMMDRQLTHLVSLVDDLLDVARITQGKIELKIESVELGPIVTAAVESSMPWLDVGKHNLSVQLSDEPLRLEADSNRLTQVFCNLLNNASKFTPPGGRISVHVRRNDSYAVVVVRDSGIGLSAESIESVFDMFSQVSGRRHDTHSGLGIGLSLVRSLVELHGGTVGVTSSGEGLGSVFEVRLPLSTKAAKCAAAQGDDVGSSENQRRYRILVADDNMDAADSLAILLQAKGHRTSIAYDGLEAMAQAEAYRPEIVFLDIGMPRMNGYEVAAAFRSSPDLADAVLVALTGWGSHEDRLRALEAGFDHHLTKPASAEALSRFFASLAT